jgi:hypothetical protein
MFLASSCRFRWDRLHRPTLPTSGDRIAPLLQYIRSGPALWDVHLAGHGEYMGYLIDAVADSPHVVNVKIDSSGNHFPISSDPTYPPQALGRLLTTNKKLESLSVPVVESNGILPNAFKSNQTTEELKLRFHELPADEEVEVVQGLLDHPTLRTLDLVLIRCSSQATLIGALSSVLPSLLSLAHLALFYDFDVEEVELLTQGLHTNRSIVKLSLQGSFTPLAATAFVEYMQTQNGVGTSGITFLSLCALRSYDVTRLTAKLLDGPRGSGLQSFEVHRVLDDSEIPEWEVMVHNKTLTTLKVHFITLSECAQFVPKLSGMADYAKALCNAVKQNASLHQVLLSKSNIGKTVFGEAWYDKVVRQVKACGERNRLLPQLLANIHDEASKSDPRNTSNDHSHGVVPQTLTLSQIPTLLRVAQQARNHLFQGLMSLNDSVGPRVQAPLRTAPSSCPL